jgi:hypothetical protein
MVWVRVSQKENCGVKNTVHAKTVKNTENTDGQKNEIQKKKENYYSRPKIGTKTKLYFENTGLYFTVHVCIFSNTTGKCLYWHAQKNTVQWLRKKLSSIRFHLYTPFHAPVHFFMHRCMGFFGLKRSSPSTFGARSETFKNEFSIQF